MEQQVLTFPGMHADQRNGQSEHSMWRDDIDRWRAQHESALSQLAKRQQIIRQHGEGLDAHAESSDTSTVCTTTKKGMAAYQREGAGAEPVLARVKMLAAVIEPAS